MFIFFQDCCPTHSKSQKYREIIFYDPINILLLPFLHRPLKHTRLSSKWYSACFDLSASFVILTRYRAAKRATREKQHILYFDAKLYKKKILCVEHTRKLLEVLILLNMLSLRWKISAPVTVARFVVGYLWYKCNLCVR